MEPIVFDNYGVECLIGKLKISSSCGVDNINSKFLTNTKVYCSIILTKLFAQSLETSCIPDEWKVGRVVPLHKSGDKHSPNNYRPVSLTSLCCKTMEHVIYSHIVNFLENNSFFTKFQHGFRKSFSCETQLICFTHDLHTILDRGSITDCIFLDFAKAFDTVPHELLLFKLSKLNLDPNVLAWLHCFLTNRYQFVNVNGTNSAFSPVNSGVPQGSVLGPLLFLIYINDLPTNISSSISLFADDCVIYKEISSDSDAIALQSDVDRVLQWCELWQMKLNINKCKSMRVSRSKTQAFCYSINNVPLEDVLSYKYLGVHIASTLSWKTHINYVVNNANRMLGYLRRNFNQATSSLKLLLYKTLVRPKLEYAAAVWDPNTASLCSELESVQNRASRFILSNYHRTSSVSSMKASLSLPLLEHRRKVFRLCLFHKIYHCNSILRSRLLSSSSYMSCRIDHQHKVHVPSCRTNLFQDSFVPSTCASWNRLPRSVAEIRNEIAFRSAITNLFS